MAADLAVAPVDFAVAAADVAVGPPSSPSPRTLSPYPTSAAVRLRTSWVGGHNTAPKVSSGRRILIVGDKSLLLLLFIRKIFFSLI